MHTGPKVEVLVNLIEDVIINEGVLTFSARFRPGGEGDAVDHWHSPGRTHHRLRTLHPRRFSALKVSDPWMLMNSPKHRNSSSFKSDDLHRVQLRTYRGH